MSGFKRENQDVEVIEPADSMPSGRSAAAPTSVPVVFANLQGTIGSAAAGQNLIDPASAYLPRSAPTSRGSA